MAKNSNRLWPQECGKPGAEESLVTEHNALLCALSRVHYRTRWWEYNYALSCAYCLLCSHPITGPIGVTEQMYLKVRLHERRHVEQLGEDKVAAAEALHHLMSDEARNTMTWFTQKVRKHYAPGCYTPTLITEGEPDSQYARQPTWDTVIKDIWGCVPNAVLPEPGR